MNFYKLRLINTIFLFIIGILIGFYFASKNNIFKKIFASYEYKPVYYGKTSSDSYTPVYIKPEVKSNLTSNVDFDISKSSKEEKKFIENIVNQNPIDDDYDFVLVASSDLKDQNESVVDVLDFIKTPANYVSKKISGSLILLKGEKQNITKLYFLYNAGNQAFYVDIEDEDGIIKKFDNFKIGYYYNVVFLSKEGSVKSGNKLLSIEDAQKKELWASGLMAF